MSDKYTPETDWGMTDDGSLIYTLRHDRWVKGESLKCNEVSIFVDVSSVFFKGNKAKKDKIRKEIAQTIQEALNANYPPSLF